MPVEDFRQKNDTIWIMMLKDRSNSYAEKMQKRNKNEIQEISYKSVAGVQVKDDGVLN